MFSNVMTFNSSSWHRRLSSATFVFSLWNCNSIAAPIALGSGVKEAAMVGAHAPCKGAAPTPLTWLIFSSRSLRDWWSSCSLWLATSRLWGCRLSRLTLMPIMKCRRRFKCSYEHCLSWSWIFSFSTLRSQKDTSRNSSIKCQQIWHQMMREKLHKMERIL